MQNNELMHYGIPHSGSTPHSGRYPYDPSLHDDATLKSRVNALKESGITKEIEIARALGYKSTTQLRKDLHVESNARRAANVSRARRYVEDGITSPTEIARLMNTNESTVRSWLNEDRAYRKELTNRTADILKDYVKSMKYVDVGKGVAEELGIPENRLKTTLGVLKDEGYQIHEIYERQVSNPNNYTTLKILTGPGVTKQEIIDHKFDIGIIGLTQKEAGTGPLNLKPVQSISSKRLAINYLEDGGKDKDGVIELRRGVKGLDLGNANYAQVRIGVDGTHYLKGMAIYSDDLPDGIDIRFNTNKSKEKVGDDKLAVLKKMKTNANGDIDKDNPFGSAIKNGPEGQRGYLNIVREEGDWATWSKTLSSQMLSKQSPALAKRQLDIAKNNSQAELEEISSLTNPVIKQHLLTAYADGADKAAVYLKAAALPRQSTSVILPVTSIKPNEIYAPQYPNGTKVVLIRHPHGGTFEIPELTVNNRNKEARKILGGANGTMAARDAVGIHHSVAERLSGADFDGDHVVVIPNMYKGKRLVRTSPKLKDLADFDPSAAYPKYEGMKIISHTHQQREMGVVSNLITDMTIQGARPTEIARAVKHSMVIIDAEKHELNYRQSEKDNNISSLKDRYQLKPDGSHGASTIISRAKSEIRVPDRDRFYKIDPNTGEKIYRETGKTIFDKKTGEEKIKTVKSTQMAETKDAYSLVSPLKANIEIIYAEHANAMKALANKARKESLNVEKYVRNPEAAKTYRKEVESLDYKLSLAKRQAPLERKAQLIANHNISLKLRDNPAIREDADQMKKVKVQALAYARSVVGKEKNRQITFTPKEWEAIQARAISKSKLKEIMAHADQDYLKKMAMPKNQKGISSAKLSRARAMRNQGYTWAEISQTLGVSVSTLQKAVE